MPKIGFGTYIPTNKTEEAVLNALQVGYRLIDTAQLYQNEYQVGSAILKSKIPRNQIFLTTKIWTSNYGYQQAKLSINESLRKLQTDYIDLLLIHEPYGGDYIGAYKAMEEFYYQGKVKSIGVSSFNQQQLQNLIDNVNIIPQVNQIETHVFNQQLEVHQFMKKYNICHQAWSPLVFGKNNIFNNETLKQIAQKHNKSTAQIALKYLLQNDVTIIPKTTHENRMKENIDLFDFNLTEEEMRQIMQLDTKKTYFNW